MHGLYFLLLVISCAIVGVSFYVSANTWNAIVMSVGCGGIASVLVAWLIDWKNHRDKKEENEKKFEIILRQYVKLYRRLIWVAENECHGLYNDDQKRSLQEWLSMLTDEARYTPLHHPTMQRRCERLSGILVALQKYIENFQVQSATLILNNFPEIEDVLAFFELQHVHAWGSLKQLEDGNYKIFSDTTYILYEEFLERFPQYKTVFPDRYNWITLKEWKI